MQVGTQNDIITLGKQFDSFLKAKHTFIIWFNQSTLWYLFNRNEIYAHIKMNVHSSFIQNSTKLETTQLSIIWWMDKQIMEYLAIQCNNSNKKEQTADICNTDESQEHYAKWKKTKYYILEMFYCLMWLCFHHNIHSSKLKLYIKNW